MVRAPTFADTETTDTTAQTLQLLRSFRRRRLRSRGGDYAYFVYLGLLTLGVYGVGTVRAVEGAIEPASYADLSTQVLAVAPPAMVAVGLLIVLAFLRDALWRGPVTVRSADADWLLPLPIDRARLLRPRLRRSIALMAGAGGLVGVGLASVIAIAGLPAGTSFVGLAAGAAGGTALLAATGSALGALVEGHPAAQEAVQIATPVIMGAVVALGVQSVLAWAGHTFPVVETVELWSGPWGWFAQPALADLGVGGSSWPVGVALLAVLTAGCAAVAHRRVPYLPAQALRTRARTLSGVGAAVMSYDPRHARLTVRAVTGRTRTRPHRRVRPPRNAMLAVPWRDMVGLMRTPARVGRTMAYSLGAYGLVVLAAARPAGLVALAPLTVVATYLAAAQLIEPARLEADNPLRATQLPYRFGMLALLHGIVPATVLLTLGAVLVAPVAVYGHLAALSVLLILVLPSTAAALVSAYRGPIPPDLFSGIDTPFGSDVAFRIGAWYAASPLVLLVSMTLPVIVALTAPPMVALIVLAAWSSAVTGLLGIWTYRRAAALAP